MINIEKILTALGMPNINKKIKSNSFEIKANDIQYKEGILEYLEEDSKIDYIIISEELPGNITTQELIKCIREINKEIKIILYIKKDEKNNKEKSKTHYNVYKIINNIEDIGLINEQKEKIKNSENTNKSNIYSTSKSTYSRKNLPAKTIDDETNKNGKVISIAGTTGIGKSTFSILLTQNMKGNKKLVIDFDILNNSVHSILGINQYPKDVIKKIKQKRESDFNFDYIDIKDFITKTKYGIDIISGLNLIFSTKNQNSPTKIRNVIKKAKKIYDVIVIDTSSYGLLDYTKEIYKVSDSIIFISGANIFEIKKSRKLLKIYEEEWEIDKRKIQIMFNKYTEESVDTEVLRNVFKDYNVLGKVKLRDYYDFIMNQRKSGIKEINNELKKIEQRLEQNNLIIKQMKNEI